MTTIDKMQLFEILRYLHMPNQMYDLCIGDNISEDITDLSNYFVTSEGEDFLSVFAAALDKAQQRNAPLKIQTL